MKNFCLMIFLFLFQSGLIFAQDMKMGKNKGPVLVIHGGAGNIKKEHFSEERVEQYKAKLQAALDTGYEVLENGGSSLDAVETAINIMEDSPMFNAGKGAVFTHDEENEMDASIMDGKTKNAGAVAGAKSIKNPISGARKVLEASEHVMLSGEGADQFAKEQQLTIEEPSYFATEKRLKHLKKVRKREETQLDHDSGEDDTKGGDGAPVDPELEKAFSDDDKYGTVGAVALDKEGNLAAATSTGGMTNKKYGRIGDSPIIGAGTYADNNTCAVSCTGHGEYFIRNVVAYDICALMDYKGVSLQKSADVIIHEKLPELGGSGGVITVDKDGNISMTFNTAGMFRGYRKPDESDVMLFGPDR